tara:strand:- start:1102 stop:1590 length:489 start_codon:yes stop_codon:yes gene_type:complete
MKIKIPYWAEEVKDENWIVLFWFLRSLTICYPPYKKRDKAGRRRGGGVNAVYHILPSDFNTIVGSRKGPHSVIAQWPTVAENFSVGLLADNHRCTMNSWYDVYEVELKEQRSKDLVLYLSGCLNNNLVTDEPRTSFAINTAIKGHFQWFMDQAEENGWYTEA